MSGDRSRLWMLLLIAPPLSLAAQVWQAGSAPSGQDLECAATTIRQAWTEGDVVRFDPLWAHAAWPNIKDLAVQELPADDPDRTWPHRRLWVIASASARGRTHWPTQWRLEGTTQCGGAQVVRLALPERGAPLYDFMDHFRDLKMSVVMDGPGERVRLPAGPWMNQDPPRYKCGVFLRDRHSCVPGHGWNWVGRIARDVDDVVRSGLWAHPPVGGHKLDLTYDDVPMGGTLEVEGGLTLAAVRAATGTPLHFEVYVGGERLLDRVVAVDEKGWLRWRIDTSKFAGSPAQVRFRVYTDDDNRMRQWMFTARTWR